MTNRTTEESLFYTAQKIKKIGIDLYILIPDFTRRITI